MPDRTTSSSDTTDTEGRISSEQLAGLIVDALVDASIVQHADFERAVKIAVEEIDARKAVGDY